MNKKSYQYFCKRYNAQVRPSQRRMVKSHPYNFCWDKDDKFNDFHINTYEVPAVDITLSEEDFGNLLYIFEEVENPQSDWSQFEYYKKRLGPDFISRAIYQIESTEREKSIREKTPALQKAWENYQLLLKISV